MQSQNRGQDPKIGGGGAQQGTDEEMEHNKPEIEANKDKRSGEMKTVEKFPQVICFKCGESSHFSSACNKPKVCFICFS
jgi:hypothetical protein